MVQIEGFLEEMVLLCQRSEEYNQFMVAKIGAVAVAAKAEAAAQETSFRGGAFNMAVRELVSYYMALVSADLALYPPRSSSGCFPAVTDASTPDFAHLAVPTWLCPSGFIHRLLIWKMAKHGGHLGLLDLGVSQALKAEGISQRDSLQKEIQQCSAVHSNPAKSRCCAAAQEEFYLEENVEKAIAIDEWSGDALTTSMVDDVFFILQKCGGRAAAAGSAQCLCAVLGQLNTLLRDSLRAALEYKWKVGRLRAASLNRETSLCDRLLHGTLSCDSLRADALECKWKVGHLPIGGIPGGVSLERVFVMSVAQYSARRPEIKVVGGAAGTAFHRHGVSFMPCCKSLCNVLYVSVALASWP